MNVKDTILFKFWMAHTKLTKVLKIACLLVDSALVAWWDCKFKQKQKSAKISLNGETKSGG